MADPDEIRTHLKNKRDGISDQFRAKTARPDEGILTAIARRDGRFAAGRWQRGENKGLAFIFSERTNGWNEVPSTGRKSAQLIFEMGSNFTSSTERERPC
jgi:hypothetical protein